MTKTRTDAWLRRAGLAAGLAIGVVALLAWRMPHSSGRLGLDLQVSATQTGELGVAPLSPFVSASGMDRGAARTGRFSIHNWTGRTISVRMRASADRRDADRDLRLRLSAGSRELFDGSLGDLRALGSDNVVLPRRGAATIAATAYLPRTAAGAFEGRIVNVQLNPVVRR